MKPQLTHIALHVADIDACMQFYMQYCHLHLIHNHQSPDNRVVWLAEPGREDELVIALFSGGQRYQQAIDQYTYLGFAMDSKAKVDGIADKASKAGLLLRHPRQEMYPKGYYCTLVDPNGHHIEFSYGQPVGLELAKKWD